jgi:hypothetical protein
MKRNLTGGFASFDPNSGNANHKGAMPGEGMLRIFDVGGLDNMKSSMAESAWTMMKRIKSETKGDSESRWGKSGYSRPSGLGDLQQSSEYGQQAQWPAAMRGSLEAGAPLIRDYFTGNSTEMPLFDSMFEDTADVDDQGSSNSVLPCNDFCIININMATGGIAYAAMEIVYPPHSLMFRALGDISSIGVQSALIRNKRQQTLLTLTQLNHTLYTERARLYDMIEQTGNHVEQSLRESDRNGRDFETANLIMRVFQFVGVLHGLERAGSYIRSASLRGTVNRSEAGCVARVCPRGITPVKNIWGSNACTNDGAGLWLVLNRRDANPKAGSAAVQALNQYREETTTLDKDHIADTYWRFEPVIGDSSSRIPRPPRSLYMTESVAGDAVKVGMVRNNHSSFHPVSTQAEKHIDRMRGLVGRALYETVPAISTDQALCSFASLHTLNIAM